MLLPVHHAAHVADDLSGRHDVRVRVRRDHEGHTSPMYRLTSSPHGALHRGFRRFAEELLGTARQVVGGDGGG